MNGKPRSIHALTDEIRPRSDLVWPVIVAAWVLLVAFTPIAWLEWLSIEAIVFCFAAGLAGVDIRMLLRRWLGMVLTVVFLAIFVALGHPARLETGMTPLIAGIVLKNGILLATIVSLVDRVGQYRILATLSRMGMPYEIVSTIATMARYGPVLADQNRRRKRARQSRMIRQSVPGLWMIQSGGLSTLLSSTLKRSERIHSAMLARGWQSERAKKELAGAAVSNRLEAGNAEPVSIVSSPGITDPT